MAWPGAFPKSCYHSLQFPKKLSWWKLEVCRRLAELNAIMACSSAGQMISMDSICNFVIYFSRFCLDNKSILSNNTVYVTTKIIITVTLFMGSQAAFVWAFF
jgi:hypothetical protein